MFETMKYVLKYETVLFSPEYDEVGNLTTVVMEKGRTLKVDISPTALIDFNLRYYGSSLRGASEGSRMILGEISMFPIVMNEKLGMYWFPSVSSLRNDCVWIALHHIIDYKSIGKKKTRVLLSDDSTVTINISRYSFEKKIQRAYALKYKVEDRTNELFLNIGESKEPYHISKELAGRNYKRVVKGM